MITYTIGTRGGPIARGIPSEDVAVALMRDAFLYDAYEGVLMRCAILVPLRRRSHGGGRRGGAPLRLLRAAPEQRSLETLSSARQRARKGNAS